MRPLFIPMTGIQQDGDTCMSQTLKKDMVGEIAYTLTIEGHVVEEVTGEDPVEYLHGAENIVPGLEKALEGKQAGDVVTVTVAPADGYGEYDEEEIDEVPVEDFEGLGDLQPGMEIEMVDEDGDSYEAIVLDVTDGKVRLDFNAPLAGKTLNYEVQVLSVRPATEEEKEVGLPQSLIDEAFDDFEDEDYEDEEEDDHSHN
jgi:FKBP-type peptidyl-prolyl cis-trans isomerase SlyD